MDLIFHNHSVNQLSTLKSVLWTYNQIRYGLKFYLWTNKDKKATYAYFKDNGLIDKYRIAPNRRQSDGSYDSDGSDFDWDTYNRDVWKLFSNDYDSKTSPESLGLNSVKAVQEQKNKLLVYFLENYADKVDIEFKSSPMSIKTPLIDDNGISITLLSRNPEFSVKSPNGAIELVISKSKKQFVTTIKDNCDRPSILIPQLGLPLFEQMFHYASIIADKPTDVMNNPHYHLGLQVNIERQFQSAQLFLLDQNKLAISRRQEQKNKYEPKSLTHDNFSDAPKATASDKIIMNPSNDNTKITKKVKVNYHSDNSSLATYQWNNIRYGVDNCVFYGIPSKDLITWLDEIEETFEWIENEHIFLYNPDVEFGLDPVVDYNDEDAWTLNGLYFKPFAKNTIFYIDENDFQLYYSLSLKNHPVTMN